MRNTALQPEVSIIVHLQAIGGEVEACFQALSEQSLANCQFIIIHDGKSGDALYFANDFAAHDARFEIYLQMGIGCGAAYNYGLDCVKAPVVGFLSGFDVVASNFCEAMARALQTTSAEIAYCDFHNTLWQKPLTQYQEVGSNISNKLYRTTFIQSKLAAFREQIWYADVLFNYQALLQNPQLVAVPEVSVKQYQHNLLKEPTTDHCYDIFPVLTTIVEQAPLETRQELLPLFLEAIFIETLPKFWSYGAKDLGTIKRQTEYCLNFLTQHFPQWREVVSTLTLGTQFHDVYGRLPQLKMQQIDGWRGLSVLGMFKIRHFWQK